MAQLNTRAFVRAQLGAFALALPLAVLGVMPAAAQQPRQPTDIEACAPCHGYDGIARDVEVPHLAGQNLVYLYNQLKAFRSGERKHKEMRYLSRHLTAREIEALAEYYAGLPRI